MLFFNHKTTLSGAQSGRFIFFLTVLCAMDNAAPSFIHPEQPKLDDRSRPGVQHTVPFQDTWAVMPYL